jgi:hypothetical protein
MSDDKEKRDRALQRRVRERMTKTGESYQAAWRQLTGAEVPPEEPAPDEESISQPPVPALTEEMLQLAAAAGVKVTLPSQLTKDTLPRDAEIEPDPPITPWESVADNPNTFSSSARQIIPLHLPRIPPRQPTRVAARATKGAVDIERLQISGAGTPGGSADWIVNDIEIDGRSQLSQKDLPGSLFGGDRVTASFNGFDPIERNREVVVTVTYVGPNPEGAPFYGAIVGIRPAQRPTIVPISSKEAVLPIATTTIQARIQNAPFQIDSVVIQNGNTAGGAADWIINDIKIAGKSQFIQSGDIPGDLFATKAIDSFIKIEACTPGVMFEIIATYIGLNERGAIFAAHLEGTVLRDDYSVSPPDLHVLVETEGQGPGDAVVATCNWRAPATDNRTR